MKKNNIKFSVLMSVYIKEKPECLEKALNSVFDQELVPNEVVLVQDGPITNELKSVIDKFKESYQDLLNLIVLEKNMGLGNALNIGLKNCKYDYVARMDTDDICHKDRFKKQIKYLEKHTDVDLIGSNIIEYDDSMIEKISLKKVPELNQDICKYIKKRNPFNHQTVIFNKKKVLNVGSYEEINLYEDYYLWCKLYINGAKFYNMQDVLVDVRGGQEMILRRGGLKYIKNNINFQIAILKLKVINVFEFLRNIIVRTFFAIIPTNWRTFMYKIFLRGSKE